MQSNRKIYYKIIGTMTSQNHTYALFAAARFVAKYNLFWIFKNKDYQSNPHREEQLGENI